MENFLFGKLTLDSLPHHWYTVGATVFIVVMFIVACSSPDETQALGVALEGMADIDRSQKDRYDVHDLCCAHVLSRA